MSTNGDQNALEQTERTSQAQPGPRYQRQTQSPNLCLKKVTRK